MAGITGEFNLPENLKLFRMAVIDEPDEKKELALD